MPDVRMRPPADPHVSIEQVADLLEGLLPVAETATVAAHLAGCARCDEMRSELEALPAVLAAAPIPPMPADLAARLDIAIATAATDRAGGHAGRPVAGAAGVTSLDGRRRSRMRDSLGVVAAAAAIVVGFVVVGDVVSEGGAADIAADSDAGTAGGGAGDSALPGEGHAGAESAAPRLGSTSLTRLSARDFQADVALLLGASSDSSVQGDSLRGLPGVDGGRFGAGSCSSRELRAAGITGGYGPRVLLDDDPVTLVSTGPQRDRLVVAYSCASGAPVEQDRARVDLTGAPR